VVRDLLNWLAPPSKLPGRDREYHRVFTLFGIVPAAWWLLDALPLMYTVLVGLIGLADARLTIEDWRA
jgi:hypothetical protein